MDAVHPPAIRPTIPKKVPVISTLFDAFVACGPRLVYRRTAGLEDLVRSMNAPGTYRGEIRNRGRIGLDDAGYKALWDESHSEDLVTLAERRGGEQVA